MDIVLVADPPKKVVDKNSNYTEGNNEIEFNEIVKTLKTFGTLQQYTDLETFSTDAHLLKDKLIFPMFWGKSSNIIKGHAPAICEINSLDYLGPNSYASIMCNDKYMIKRIIHTFDLKTAPSVLIYESMDSQMILEKLELLNFPVIVKPNYGGGSTGITKTNLVDTVKDALEKINELFQLGFSPLIVEEYIEGYEISILLIGNMNEVKFSEQMMLFNNNKNYFSHSIWSVEDKKVTITNSYYETTDLLLKTIIEKAKKLFQYFDKVEYLRVDGRLNKNGFFVLELSPDCYLGPNSDFHIAFTKKGKSYRDFISFLISNHLESNKSGIPQ